MCGIAGIVESHGRQAGPERLRAMIAMLAHRGPDAAGVFTDREAGLAHARLSIIDIAGGAQPMASTDARLWIVFNGEIFNYLELQEELSAKGHVFASRSDTEVILHLYQEYGEACVERMNGQWAFAIWDKTARKLFLSRDRMGIRPLYYTEADGAFYFASEMKAFLPCPDVSFETDIQALEQYLTFWVAVPPHTPFRRIRQLPPAHSMVVQDGRIRSWSYWNLQYAPQPVTGARNEKKLTEDLLDLLLDATRIRLRSDVPVGAYLSGGLDSTLIAALTRQIAGDRLRSFSVSFEDEEFDEGAYQKEASRMLGTDHAEIRIRQGDIARVFPDVVWHAEQPILRTAPAPMYVLSHLVRRSGFKVVLTGEGADEILGGYDIFKEAKIRRFCARNPSSPWRPLLLKRLYPYMDRMQQQSTTYLKSFFHVSEEDIANPYFSHLPRWGLAARLKLLLTDDARAEMASGSPLASMEMDLAADFPSWNDFNRAEFLEARYLLPGYILSTQGDRVAMAHSVEGRYPFLDYRVVEFAASLPPNLKMKALCEKYLLKQAARPYVPESIRKRAKQPYRAPDGKSFVGPDGDYLDQLLSPERLRDAGIFAPRAVASLLGKFRTGRANSTTDNIGLVAVLSSQLLHEQFVRRGGLSWRANPDTADPAHRSASDTYREVAATSKEYQIS